MIDHTELAPAPSAAIATTNYGFDVERVVAMRRAVLDVIQRVMIEGEHYGVIPGTTQQGKKPKKALLQSGAEVLCQVFRLRPQFFIVDKAERDDFLFYEITCKLYNAQSGELVSESIGSANTREDKYSARTSARLCPLCGKPTIFKSKKENGGYYCWAKKDGCGAEFADDDKRLLENTGAISTNKIWDLHHTIVSMAQKRAYVKAVRNATACSDVFTDEQEDDDPNEHAPRTQAAAKPASGPKATAVQIRDLNTALNELEVGVMESADLTGRAREESLMNSRIEWINGFLAKPVKMLSELTPEQADKLIAAARAGQMPDIER